MWFEGLYRITRCYLNVTAMRRCLFIAVIYAVALPLLASAQGGPEKFRRINCSSCGRRRHRPWFARPAAQKRAEAYKNYFQNFTVDSQRREPEAVLVAADSKQSHRPRLTVEPFAKAAKLPIDNRFANKQPADLAAELRANYQGKVILICWHHGQIPALLRALGAAPETVIRRRQMAPRRLRLGHHGLASMKTDM